MQMLVAETVDYTTLVNCRGYHLASPKTDLPKKMTGEVLEGRRSSGGKRLLF